MSNQNVSGADDFVRRMQEAKEYLQTDIYDVVGTEAVKLFKESFQVEGFIDNGVKKWATRKTKRAGSTNGQKVLSKSGELSESIDYEKSPGVVSIVSDKAYAEIHNEGGEIEVTPAMKRFFWAKHKEAKDAGNLEMAEQYKGMALAKRIRIPKRQFIGESAELES